jgi:hypothetical protein
MIYAYFTPGSVQECWSSGFYFFNQFLVNASFHNFMVRIYTFLVASFAQLPLWSTSAYQQGRTLLCKRTQKSKYGIFGGTISSCN